MTELSLREQLILSAQGKCKHFNGTVHETCDAGVNYRELVGGETLGWGLRLPCGLRLPAGKKPVEPVTCDKRAIYTAEEAADRSDQMMRRMDQVSTAMKACREDAKQHGFKKGKGGQNTITCPICESGQLSYSVAGYNGHLWGRCSSAGCVQWMQ